MIDAVSDKEHHCADEYYVEVNVNSDFHDSWHNQDRVEGRQIIIIEFKIRIAVIIKNWIWCRIENKDQ